MTKDSVSRRPLDRTIMAFLGVCLLMLPSVASFQPVIPVKTIVSPSFTPCSQLSSKPHHHNLHRISASTSKRSPTTLNLIPLTSGGGGELEALSSLLTAAIPIFDGNTIVDPVVVSNAFWDGLTRQFVSLIIGQFLAATVFGLLTTVAASQMSKLGTFVTDSIFPDSKKNKKKKKSGLQQPPPGYTGPPLKVTPDLPKLLICILIDIIGTSSELVPIVGELSDIVWAPVAALLLRSLYGGSNIIFGLEFAEEILPFTDILPLATICWVVDTFFRDSDIAKLLQLGIYRQGQEDVVIDTRPLKKSYSSGSSKDKKGIRGGKFIDVDIETDRLDKRK